VVAPYALSSTGQLMLSPENAEVLGVEEGRAVLAATLALPGVAEGSGDWRADAQRTGYDKGRDEGEG
jgi:arginine N-succinyltransferase